MLCELLLSLSVLSCQRELELQPTPGQDVSTSLTGEIVFTVTDADAELLTKSSRAEEKSTISYGMIQQSDGNRKHIADITMDYEPLELPTWSDSLQTKADVTGLSSFYVTCVTGSAGSESQSWGNVGFSGSSTFSGGKYWPSSNLGYKFYASNASLSFASGGTTVYASNSTDVVVAYKTDATYYASSNSLSFSHIFGKLGRVTITTVDDKVASDVSITLTPKVSGTYNIRTGEWSGVSTGSAVNIAPTGNGYKDNNIYLVPGNYTINANWTLTKGNSKSFSASTDITITAGYCSNLTITLDGTLKVWGSFGGYYWSPAPLYYNGSSLEIRDDYWLVGSADEGGSYKPNVTSLKNYFGVDSNNNLDFHLNMISYNDFEWYVPSQQIYNVLFNYTGSSIGTLRKGATVMGNTDCFWSKIFLSSDVVYQERSGPSGFLFYPDGKTITGKSRTFPFNTIDKKTAQNSNVTLNQLNQYLDEGCVFLPCVAPPDGATSTDTNYRTSEEGYNNTYLRSIQIPWSSTSSDPFQSNATNSACWVYLVTWDHEAPLSFGGFQIAPCNAMWDGEKFVIPYNDWNHESYKTISGLNTGSYYFTFIELGSYFSSERNFSTKSGNINNGRKVSYGGYSDWRVPTADELRKIVTGSRPGACINGIPGCKSAKVRITDVSHGGKTWTFGLLLLPDGLRLDGMAKTYTWNNTSTTCDVTTLDELQPYLNAGCALIPGSGGISTSYSGTSWSSSYVYLLTASQPTSGTSSSQASNVVTLNTASDKILSFTSASKTNVSYCVRLIRDI